MTPPKRPDEQRHEGECRDHPGAEARLSRRIRNQIAHRADLVCRHLRIDRGDDAAQRACKTPGLKGRAQDNRGTCFHIRNLAIGNVHLRNSRDVQSIVMDVAGDTDDGPPLVVAKALALHNWSTAPQNFRAID